MPDLDSKTEKEIELMSAQIEQIQATIQGMREDSRLRWAEHARMQAEYQQTHQRLQQEYEQRRRDDEARHKAQLRATTVTAVIAAGAVVLAALFAFAATLFGPLLAGP